MHEHSNRSFCYVAEECPSMGHLVGMRVLLRDQREPQHRVRRSDRHVLEHSCSEGWKEMEDRAHAKSGVLVS